LIVSPSRSVLLVEDNVLLAQMLRSALESHGCHVSHAVTARDALHWLTAHEPQLVVLDDELPDGWGVDIARALRVHARQRTEEGEDVRPLPIIAMRTDVDREPVEPWVPDRQTVVINKPIQIQAFAALVGQYLDASALPEPVDVDLEELEDADPLNAYAASDEDDSPMP
jgi:CheY-like chemotaxis protein